MEYLVSMTTRVPGGTPDEAVQDIRAREAAHSRELAAQGHLLRLWRPPLQPGQWRTLGLFAAAGARRSTDNDEIRPGPWPAWTGTRPISSPPISLVPPDKQPTA